eukprot:scaffold87814_cov63-Phaeocystis_antarctica.AAC.2
MVHAEASLRKPKPPRLRYSAAAKGFLWGRWPALTQSGTMSQSLVNSCRTVNTVPAGGALLGVDSAACDSAACLSTAARRSRAVSMVPPPPLLASSESMVLVNMRHFTADQGRLARTANMVATAGGGRERTSIR